MARSTSQAFKYCCFVTCLSVSQGTLQCLDEKQLALIYLQCKHISVSMTRSEQQRNTKSPKKSGGWGLVAVYTFTQETRVRVPCETNYFSKPKQVILCLNLMLLKQSRFLLCLD